MAKVKFGFDQIDVPSPKKLKLFVNAVIIVGGAIGGIVLITPDNVLNPEIKAYILGVGGVLAGALKSFEKLTGVTTEDSE